MNVIRNVVSQTVNDNIYNQQDVDFVLDHSCPEVFESKFDKI